VRIQGARKRHGTSGWCEPFLMADSQDLPDCNPVLFIDPRGTLWLFWIAVLSNQWGGSLLKFRTAIQYSEDGPPKWDWQDVIHCRPKNLEEPFLAMVKELEVSLAAVLAQNKRLQEEAEKAKAAAKDKLSQRLGWMTRLHPIMLSENRMMLGLYSDVFNGSLAAFTNDWGKTWEFSEPILGMGNIQPSFVRRRDGTIVAMMRDNGLPKHIRIADSTDGGMTWSKVRTSEIPNPGSSLECIPLKSGNWILVCNDTPEGRHILTAYLSDDEGATWKSKRSLERFEKDQGSASYPSVIQTSDGSIHCTYSFTTKEIPGSTIKHARFNEEWVKAGDAR
jgi:predicted neuraminidase